MRVEKFEDLVAWQKGRELSVRIYKLFSGNKDFGFRDQIQRAVISIVNNIAEGFERQSNGELKYFLYVAKGSAGEVRSMLYIAIELGYIDGDNFKKLSSLAEEVSRLISAFIKKL